MIIPFGQYRNKLLNDIINEDRQYLEWLNTQPWFKIKYDELYREIQKNLIQSIKNTEISSDQFVIYTDGACSHNGSNRAKGGIGVYFSPSNEIKIPNISSKLEVEKPTNNIAELVAILSALKECAEYKVTHPIIIFTDSQYSINCINCWFPVWVKKNTLKGKKNVDILAQINNILPPNLELIHIRAQHDTKLTDEHSIGNKMADQLAVNGINK